jgi:toxin YoeB
MYKPDFSKRFKQEYDRLCDRDKPKADKIDDLIADTLKHPTEGIGHPKRLRHFGENIWSRHVDKKNRLVYKIVGRVVWFDSCEGHYDDH